MAIGRAASRGMGVHAEEFAGEDKGDPLRAVEQGPGGYSLNGSE